MSKPRPIPFVSVTNANEVRRKVFCLHYDYCLDHAILLGWRGFACDECDSFERESMDWRQWDEDHNRCMALIYLASFGETDSMEDRRGAA